MKNKFLILEWIVILIFLVIPPLLVNPGTSAAIANNGKISPYLLLRLIIAIFLYYQQIYVIKKTPQEQNGKFKKTVLFLSWSAICFGLHMITQALFQAISLVLPLKYNETVFDFNLDSKSCIVAFLNLLTGAFYEEVLYREYLPETMLMFSRGRKFLSNLSEGLCVVVFAMSHRYLGLLPVLNAFLGGMILRICRKKSLSIWTCTIAHFMYNAVLFVFAILQQK